MSNVNHPPAIIREPPAAVSRRLTDISYDEEVFDIAAPLYNNALKRSGYSESATYIQTRKSVRPEPRHRVRSRRVTWFNPPFSKGVAANIARRFLRLIDVHFPNGNKLNAIFNRNTVKKSYSFMSNVDSIIKRHNARVCTQEVGSGEPGRRCNCRRPLECPLNGVCLASGIVCEAFVKTTVGGSVHYPLTTGIPTEIRYIGSTDITFKARYANHKASLTHVDKAHLAELSKYVWKMKEKNTRHEITWRIVRPTPGLTSE